MESLVLISFEKSSNDAELLNDSELAIEMELESETDSLVEAVSESAAL
jgi:hypothetical protein